MPKKPRKATPSLKLFDFHGADTTLQSHNDEGRGTCIFCSRQGHFYANAISQKWSCHSCLAEGNALQFLERLWQDSDEATTEYTELAKDRGLLFPDTLMRWGLAQSIGTGQWLVPAFSVQGKLTQLYQRRPTKQGWALMPSPGFGHNLLGLHLFEDDRATVYICEGIWDAMVLWEILGHTHVDSDPRDLKETSNPDDSMLRTVAVLAVPGCGTFFSAWSQYFSNRDVFLCYDSDHPRRHRRSGKLLAPAGLAGMQRVAGILQGTAASLNYLRWGPDGYDPDLPTGYDLRDLLANRPT